MAAAWPGFDEQPAVVFPARPRNSRLRHGSDAYIMNRASPQAIMMDANGNMLPPLVDQFGRLRASSVQGTRPAAIVINNDNGAQNNQHLEEERPRSSSHRRHHSSSSRHWDDDRSPARRSRRRRDSDFSDESDFEEVWDRSRGRYVRYYHHRRRSSRSSSRRRGKRSAEDEAKLKELAELKGKVEREAEAKKILEEEALKRLKEEKKRLDREAEDKALKEKAIEDYKVKMIEEDAKRKKEEEELEERLVATLMAGSPGMTESQARKYVRKAERNKERAGRGDREEGFSDELILAESSRPTHIKVHKTYLSPETLNKYNLPWDYDERDSNYIIIKKWISEQQQEILFNHTALIKERSRLLYPRERLRADGNQIVLLKKDKEEKQTV